jgi:hypothetical protein
MEPNDLPIVCIPVDLPDEAAASLLEFFQNLTEALQRHYFGQLRRHDQARDERRSDLDAHVTGPGPHPPF